MIKKYIAIGVFSTLAACSGGEFLSPLEDEAEIPTSEIPATLAGNLTSISFNPGAETITVELNGLDSTPVNAVYTRRASLDINGYSAYAVQEDALDRLFVALVGQSDDGSVTVGVVRDGGQFDRVFSGAYYGRNGSFSRPAIGPGPGQGQVSYAGGYAGLVNGGGTDGLIPVPNPGTVDPVLLPGGEPLQISGSVFINANFADDTVNGAIYDRVLVDLNLALDSIILLPTDIAADGTFFGDVIPDPDANGGAGGVGSGDFGGIFGGASASSVGGIVTLTEFSDLLENENELGVFVLTQCGLPNDAPICDNVAPF